MKKLKVTFILPDVDVSGGVKAVLEFSNHLISRGHDVTVVYPLLPMSGGGGWYNPGVMLRRGRGLGSNIRAGNSIDWFDYRGNLVRAPTLAEKHVPDGDVVVATWWETAYHVKRYGRSKGEKFYLVQHYEVWGGPKKDVDMTYRLGLWNVVNSSWLKEILEKEIGAPVEALVPHAPDLDQFYPEGRREGSDTVRVLIPYRDIEWKGIEDGVRAFEIARKRRPELRMVMFGPRRGRDAPEYAEFHENPSRDELRRIYNSCEIFVFPSRCEGFGMPPMEAMACRCAVVTTRVGAVPDYTIDGETALVCPPRSPEAMAECIVRLAEDEGLRTRIAQGGHRHITSNFSWARSTEMLEEVFLRILER